MVPAWFQIGSTMVPTLYRSRNPMNSHGSCSAALKFHDLKAFFPKSAAVQPGQLQEVMLHETAVSWMRDRLTKTLPKRCWEEAPDAYRARLKACAAHINGSCDVEGLCRELPSRVRDLADREGDRLAK